MADFFPRIDSKTIASSAITMAGLPVFLLGASLLFQTLFFFATSFEVPALVAARLTASAIFFVIGATLVYASFRLRRGKPGLVPLSVFIACANFLGACFNLGFLAPGTRILLLTVPALCLLLSINGVRGWLWMRRNKTAI